MSFLPTNPGTAKHEMALFLQKNPHTDNQELIDRYKHFRSVELSGSPCKRGARTMFFTLILSIDAGFPEGVFQTLVIGVEPVKGLLADPRIHGVTFTGSVRAGRDVAQTASANIKKAVLELGGSDPFIVFATLRVLARIGRGQGPLLQYLSQRR